MWEITLIGETQDNINFLVFEKMIKSRFDSSILVAISSDNHNTRLSIAVKNKKIIYIVKKLIIELILKICKEEYFSENLIIKTQDEEMKRFILLTAVISNIEDEIDYARVKFKFSKIIHIRSLVRFRLSKLCSLWEKFALYFNYNFSNVICDDIYLDFLKFLTLNSHRNSDIIYLMNDKDKMYLKDKNQKVLVSVPKNDEIGVIVNLIVLAPDKLVINCYSTLSTKVAGLIRYLFDDRVSILI